jgi:hypothetical protein
MKRGIIVSGLALVAFACATGAEPHPPATPAPAAPVVVADAAPPPVAAAPAFEAPPSGEYELTSELAADTCPGPDGGIPIGPKRKVFVYVKTARGSTHVTFPLITGGLGGVIMPRTDIVIDPPSDGISHVAHPQKSCPAFEEKVTTKVVLATRDHLRVSLQREYGDASGCPAPRLFLAKCKRELIDDYRLVPNRCDARCTADQVKLADGGVDMKCSCPDGGAP